LVEAVRKTKGVPEVSKSIACANAKEIEVYLPSAARFDGVPPKDHLISDAESGS